MSPTRSEAGSVGGVNVEAERHLFRRCLIGAAVLVVLLALPLIRTTPTPTATLFSLAGLVLCGAVAVVSGFHRARHTSGRYATGWFILACGGVFGVVANSSTLAMTVGLLPSGWRGYSDPLLLLALASGSAGLVLFSPVPQRAVHLARLLLDAVVIGGSVLFVASVTIFPQLLSGASDQSVLGRVQTLALPVIDVLLATLATLLITRSSRVSRIPLALIGSGFCLYAMSDLWYAVLATTYSQALGTFGDLGWMAGYLLIGLAARHPAAGKAPVSGPQETSATLTTSLLFALFLVATVISVARLHDASLSTAQSAMWIVVILAVVGRQVLLVVDNEGLRRNLERLVTARTRDLRAVTKQQELLLTSVGDGIYGVDATGTISFVNVAAARLLRRAADEIIGANAHDLFHARRRRDGTPYTKDTCYITEAIRFGVGVTAEDDQYLRGDGRVIAVEATASPLSDDGLISGAVVVFRDVSQRREVDRMKSEFVSMVSHELRTPLTAMRGSLGLVAGGAFGELPGRANHMIGIALTGTDRLSRLINDILDIERIESATIAVEPTVCEVRSMCEEAVFTINGLPDQVNVTLGPCSGVVIADRDRTVQTLINLLGNAVKFSPVGEQVELRAEPSGVEVKFTVTDHGRGIPADRLEVIFDRFTQVDSTDAREKGGTGLGLAISRALVEQQGGRIWAESVLGEGSAFHFTLPRATKDQQLTGEVTTGDSGTVSTIEN